MKFGKLALFYNPSIFRNYVYALHGLSHGILYFGSSILRFTTCWSYSALGRSLKSNLCTLRRNEIFLKRIIFGFLSDRGMRHFHRDNNFWEFCSKVF